jgi:hypothetical protein
MPKAITAKTFMNKCVSRSDCILLVNPPVEETRYAWLRWNQPLDLLKIGGYLKQRVGCNVELLDFMKSDTRGRVIQQRLPGARQECIVGGERYPMRRYGLPYSELTKWVVKRRSAGAKLPTQVWVTSLCSYWFQSVAQVCREVRQALPDAQIVLIGSCAQFMPSHAANTCPVDIIVTKTFDIADIPAALDLYQDKRRPFAALRLNPKTAVAEIKAAIDKETYDFAFFEEDICIDDGEQLIEIVEMTEQLHPRVRFHVICGVDPRKVTPKLAKILAKKCFADLHFEEASDGEQLAVDLYVNDGVGDLEPGGRLPEYSILTTSRGCPFKCAYCAANVLNEGRRVWVRNYELAYEEVKHLFSRGIREFCFYEDNLLLGRDNFINLLRLIADNPELRGIE